MGRSSLLGRADLLACLADQGEDRLEAMAAALGYVRLPEKAPESPRAPRATPPPRTSTDVSPPPVTPPNIQARFYRVVAQRRLEPEEVVAETPRSFRNAEPLLDSVRAPEGAVAPPQEPLMPWSRLWPFLKAALGARRAGKALDLPRLVALLARGAVPRCLPRKRRQGWAGNAQIVLDYALPLLPFWTDFNDTLKRLRRLRGDGGLMILALPDGDPAGSCWRLEGRGWRELEGYPIPAPGTPVLVLGDLGCIDRTDLRRRRWQRLGRRLKRAECRLVALMTCPSRWWDEVLSRLFLPVCWDRDVRPPRRLGARDARPVPAARPERDAGAEQLLALLTFAIRVEPGLLRAVRHRLSAGAADVGSEAAAWNHSLVHATALAFYYDARALAHYRRLYREQPEDLRGQVAGLVAAYHAPLSPVIRYEEDWLRAALDRKAMPHKPVTFLWQVAKTLVHHPDASGAETLRAWVRRYGPRQHESVWRDEAPAAAWVAAHLPRLRAREALNFPRGLELGRVSWLLAQGRETTRYVLRQRGEALFLEGESVPDGSDAPGSPLGEVHAAAPVLRLRSPEANLAAGARTQPLEQGIELSWEGGLEIATDRQELTIESLGKPEWAEDIGRDEYGLYAGFQIEGVYQRLRWIVPGEFWMGSPEEEAERKDDETRHWVVLSRGYWLADTACTQALWEAVMGDNPSEFKGAQRPVERVSWEDVQVFLQRLNEGIPGGGFRLPTEAQWEYACRAGTATPFWFGEQITPEQANYDGNSPYAGGPKGKYRKQTVEVKALPCNGWGLYQMHGNVWEWCADWYGDYPMGSAVDPEGPDWGVVRVLRGGGWALGGWFLRSACRYASLPGRRGALIGFRLVRGRAGGG